MNPHPHEILTEDQIEKTFAELEERLLELETMYYDKFNEIHIIFSKLQRHYLPEKFKFKGIVPKFSLEDSQSIDNIFGDNSQFKQNFTKMMSEQLNLALGDDGLTKADKK